MKKHISLVIWLVLLVAISAAPVWAQFTGTVKGVAKDESGKPIQGATVELLNAENGRKINLKTNSKGEYFSIGIAFGTYKFSLMVDGKVVDFFDKVPVQAGEERVIDFDLAKEKAQAAQKAGITPEQQKKIEETQKQNEKIKGLNTQLTQAKQLETAADASQAQAQQLEAAGNHDQAQAKQLEAKANYDQAISILQQAAQADPNQDVLWANLGEAQSKAKKYPEAIESYQKAIAIKPTSGIYHDRLADAYAKSGQTDKAAQEYAAAAQSDPANAGMYYFDEGAVLVNSNKVEKMDEAIVAFDKSLQIDPNRADAYYFKATALVGKATTKDNKMIVPEGTAEAFNKYLSLQPNGKFADLAKQYLAAIGAPVETTYGKSKPAPKKKP